jgi:Bacterial Ig-like domain (group 2)/Electron transfer DM13
MLNKVKYRSAVKKIILAALIITQFIACTKKMDVPEPAPVVPTVPERLEVTPTTGSAIVGGTTQFTAKYYNTIGELAPLPAGAVWSSSSPTVATVSTQGLVTAVAAGSTNIKIALNAASAIATYTVVANSNQLATVTLTPNTSQDITLNQTVAFSAVGANAAGGTVSGLTFSWMSSATPAVTISAAGMATAVGYGAANITATANGVQSAPTIVNVVRQGTFSGVGSTGTAKLKIENGVLKLSTSSNFFVNNAPDLRIYLSANTNNIMNSVQISPLSTIGQTSGARSWNVPAGVTITQYRYVLVWCAQFGGSYGLADLGL